MKKLLTFFAPIMVLSFPSMTIKNNEDEFKADIRWDISQNTGSRQFPYRISTHGQVNNAKLKFDTTSYGGFNSFVEKYPSFTFKNTSLSVSFDNKYSYVVLDKIYNTKDFDNKDGLYTIAESKAYYVNSDFMLLSAEGAHINNVIYFTITYAVELGHGYRPLPFYKSTTDSLVFLP